MAEAIARYLIDGGLLGPDPDVFVASAGVATSGGAPPTPEAIEALRALGIEHDGRSKTLTGDMVANARVVLCMTEDHVRTAAELAPADAEAKIMRLDPQGDIEDPLGLDQAAYDALARRFLELIPARLTEALDHEDRAGVGSSGG